MVISLRTIRFVQTILLALACGAPFTSAQAMLAGDAPSILKDAAAAHAATSLLKSSGSYTVHEFSSNAVTIREYLNADGRVFAVTWSGLGKPNLKQLLGDSFKEFGSAASARPHAGNSQLRYAGNDLVIESIGRASHFSGRAYLRSLMPGDVQLGRII
jgi:hypothetical protein